MATLDYIGCVRDESARFRDAVTPATVDLPVAGCPGWSLLDLSHHLGQVQRWARLAATTGARPDDADIDPPPSDGDFEALKRWLSDGSDALCLALAAVPDDAPTWHPFPVPKVAGVWPRRQAHEVAIHRWDAQRAAGTSVDPFDPAVATDFIREYFEVIVPRVTDRDARTAPAGRLAVRLTNVDVNVLVSSTGRSVAVEPLDDEPPDGELAGPVDDVLLALWQRTPLATRDPLAAQWLAFGGN